LEEVEDVEVFNCIGGQQGNGGLLGLYTDELGNVFIDKFANERKQHPFNPSGTECQKWSSGGSKTWNTVGK
jgi:hypothetical protein